MEEYKTFTGYYDELLEAKTDKELNAVLYRQNGVDMAYQNSAITWNTHQRLFRLASKLTSNNYYKYLYNKQNEQLEAVKAHLYVIADNDPHAYAVELHECGYGWHEAREALKAFCKLSIAEASKILSDIYKDE